MASPLPRPRVPHPHVRIDDAVIGGSPHVVGSRVPVRRLWAWHRGGASVETLVKRYPNLGPARILDALSFAYDNQELIEADIEREQAMLDKAGPAVGARPLAQLPLPFEASAAPRQPEPEHHTVTPDVGFAPQAKSDAGNKAPQKERPPAKTARTERGR
jgi:uncharacterized protein (DUF433 family)